MSDKKYKFRPPLKRKAVEEITSESSEHMKTSEDICENKVIKNQNNTENVAKIEDKFVFTVANGKTASVSVNKIRKVAKELNKVLAEDNNTDGTNESIDSNNNQLVPEFVTTEETTDTKTIDNNSRNGLVLDKMFFEELEEDFH